MPDQYVLSYVSRQEVQDASDPPMVEFILVNSHAAFDVHAPYVYDRQALSDGSLFHSPPRRRPRRLVRPARTRRGL